VPYFDTTDEDHLKFLPDDIRSASDELANVAAEAEADVIAHYTAPADDTDLHTSYYSINTRTCTELTDANGDGIGLYVWLRGYAADPTNAEQNFAAAMRREIAGVIRWRWTQRRKDPLLRFEASGQFKSRTFTTDSENPFPPGFGRWLAPYDTRRQLEILG